MKKKHELITTDIRQQEILEVVNNSHLTLDQTSTPIQIDREEIIHFYFPLASKLHNLIRGEKRILVAVAGPPGSGKSVFTALLVVVINAIAGCEEAIQIQQDGWHFTNEYLDTLTFQKEGVEIPLRSIKGAPETYDTDSAYECLKNIRQGMQVQIPVYSRTLHDPVPNARVIKPNHLIAVVEGNYWLLKVPPWDKFQKLFDVSIFLTANPETLLEGLCLRQLRGGRTRKVAEQQVYNVDLPNINYVLMNSSPANFVVYKAENQRILKVEDRFTDKSSQFT
jgi:pantothenate kinase